MKFRRHPTEVAVSKLLLRADHAPLGEWVELGAANYRSRDTAMWDTISPKPD